MPFPLCSWLKGRSARDLTQAAASKKKIELIDEVHRMEGFASENSARGAIKAAEVHQDNSAQFWSNCWLPGLVVCPALAWPHHKIFFDRFQNLRNLRLWFWEFETLPNWVLHGTSPVSVFWLKFLHCSKKFCGWTFLFLSLKVGTFWSLERFVRFLATRRLLLKVYLSVRVETFVCLWSIFPLELFLISFVRWSFTCSVTLLLFDCVCDRCQSSDYYWCTISGSEEQREDNSLSYSEQAECWIRNVSEYTGPIAWALCWTPQLQSFRTPTLSGASVKDFKEILSLLNLCLPVMRQAIQMISFWIYSASFRSISDSFKRFLISQSCQRRLSGVINLFLLTLSYSPMSFRIPSIFIGIVRLLPVMKLSYQSHCWNPWYSRVAARWSGASYLQVD